jgi:predicted nucleic acid-binding Zn ribbon protein
LNDDDQKLKRIINKLFTKEDRLSRAYNEFSIDQIWRETFGSMIASYTTSVKYHKGTLTVCISSAPLKQELSMSKDAVILKLNKALKYKKVEKLYIQ